MTDSRSNGRSADDSRSSASADDRQPNARRANDPRTGGRDATSDRCAQCDGAVASDEWHPVVTERDDDGRIEIFDFCSEACRDEWDEDREQ